MTKLPMWIRKDNPSDFELAKYLLEVSNLVGAVDKVSCFAKEGVHSSGNDNGIELTLFTGGT